MDTTVITITRPADIVAYIPYRLGFRPRDSIVLVAMCGPRNRLGLVSRVDLADVAEPRTGPEILLGLIDLMEKDGAHDVFVVLYSDLLRSLLAEDAHVGGALRHLRALTSWADPPGPWVVGAHGHGPWGEDEECAPATGRTRDLEQGTIAATMVLHGMTVVRERDDLAIPRSTDPERRRAVTRAARDARRRRAEARREAVAGAVVADPTSGEYRGELRQWREEEWRRWHRMVRLARRGAALPAGELGRLAVGLEDAAVRGAALGSLVLPCPGGLPDAAEARRAVESVMLPGGPPPEPDRVEPATAVRRALAACAPRRQGAVALAMLAFVAWWSADGARADVLAKQALRARPRITLAEIVDQAVDAQVPPGWVRTAPGGVSPAGSPPIR